MKWLSNHRSASVYSIVPFGKNASMCHAVMLEGTAVASIWYGVKSRSLESGPDLGPGGMILSASGTTGMAVVGRSEHLQRTPSPRRMAGHLTKRT